tara:strand:+ start:1561 stop:1746 length:186 start_codon:yes stop_codon:yes gene_type:complete
MALDKVTLVQAIKDLRNIDTSNGGIENDDLANALADAIEVFVMSGDVVVATGSSSGTYKVT